MKKISLIAAAVLASLTLAACGNSASQHKAKRANSSSKVVHHKHHKKQQHKKKAASSSSSSSSSVQSSNNQQQSQQVQGKQANPADESTWNLPYKGFSSYNAYIEYYHGDPDVQRQTAQMQHDENVRRGIEDANGNETQNFKNWVAARDNAWNNGNDNFPDYDQNQQW